MLETTVNEVRYAQRLLLLAVHLALYVAKSLGKEPSILMIDGVVRWMLPFFVSMKCLRVHAKLHSPIVA